MTSSLEFDDRGDILVVTLRGDVDGTIAVRAADDICGEVPNTAVGLVLDLSEVTYIDSAGISALLTVGARLRTRHQRVRIALPDVSPIRPTLAFAGVPQAVPLCRDTAHAVLSIQADEA